MLVFNSPIFTKQYLQHQALILLVSLIAAHFVVTHHAPESWLELWQLDFYYSSVAYSLIVAFLLINYIRFATLKINQRQNGLNVNLKRFKQQLVVGVGGAIVIELIMAGVVYHFNGLSIVNNDFFNKLFASIFLFILIINLSYCFYHYYLTQQNLPMQIKVITELKKEVRYKLIQPIQQKQPLVKQLPLLIYIVQKVPLAYDAKGTLIDWSHNIKTSLQLLPAQDYFRLNKNCIIHRAIIKQTKPHIGNFLLIVPMVTLPITLITSRRKTLPFKKWLANEG